jgi:hypothetical protein
MTAPVRLILLILESCVKELVGEDPLLSGEDCDYVQDYLLQPGKWFSFEYVVFGNLASSLPGEVNLRLWKKMLTSFREFHLATYDELLVNILYNVAASFLSHRLDPQNKQNNENLKVFLLGTRIVDEALFKKNVDALKELSVDVHTILPSET